jgi:fructose/tagatose bisphosphate aldolase
LRDNMTDLELIFTMLWEKVTTEISENEEPETFEENKKVANRWWNVAKNARIETEKEIGKKVSVEKNFLERRNKKELK